MGYHYHLINDTKYPFSHLPLAADTIDCYEVAKRVSATTDVPVVSALMYGCSHYQTVFLSIVV